MATPITDMRSRQCLPFSWTTLSRGKHCRRPIVVNGVCTCLRVISFYFWLWSWEFLRSRWDTRILTSFLPLFLDLWVKMYFVLSCKKVLGCHLILHWGRRHFRSSSWLVFIAWCHNCVKWCKGCQSSCECWVIVLWYKVIYKRGIENCSAA